MSQQVNLSTKVAKSDWNKKYFPEQAQSPAWDTTRTETDSEDDEDEYSLDDETFLQFSDDEEKEREEGDGREGRSKGGRYPEDQFSEDEKKGREWDYKGEVYPEEESGRKRPTMVTKPRVTVTFPPLPQVGTALQSNVRRLGRRKELQMMRREKLRWGFEKSSPLIAIGVEEAEGARQTQAREGGEGDKGRMGSIDTRASSSQGRRGRNYKKGYYQGGSLSIITIHKEYRFETEERSTPPHFPQALVTNDSAEGAGQESQPPPTSGEDAQLKQEDKRKTKTEKAGTSPAAAVGMGKLLELLWGITIPEEYTFETEQPGTPAHIPQSLVAGDSTDGAGQGLPPPPFSGDDAQLKQGGKRKNKTEEAGTSLAGGPAAAGVGKRRGLLWGRKKLLASPLLCDADAFDAYEGNGACEYPLTL
ncbi:hypothetical protein BDZ91DRAFT_235845 [Kalaharituber pfeilii]|nr:hypothetical protein BDZ91DRAFT_235845 [Kalaharituber pfeilii]